MSNYKISPDRPEIVHAQHYRNELRREAEAYRLAAQAYRERSQSSWWQRIASLFARTDEDAPIENATSERIELTQSQTMTPIDAKLITNQ